MQDLPEQIGMRVTVGKSNSDPAYTDPDLCTDLEQLQENGVTLGLGHGSAVETQTPQGLHQHISERGKIQAQLIGTHLMG